MKDALAATTDAASASESRIFMVQHVYRDIDVRQFALPLAVAALVAYFALSADYFFDLTNFQNIGQQGAALAVVAFGQTFVILTAGLDLSVGATIGLVSVTTAWGGSHYGLAGALCCGLGSAVVVGLVNGLIIVRLRVAPFIATLATTSVVAGAALMISGGIPLTGVPTTLTNLSTTKIGPMPAVVAISLVFFVLAYVLLRWTRLGHYFFAVGGNAEAARLAGIPNGTVLLGAYVLCSLFTGIGGVILTARVYSGQPNLGQSLTLEAIAAVVLGGVSLFGGRGSIIGVAFGVAFISILANGLNLMNVASYTQMLVIGAALVAAVAFDRLIARRVGEE
jgi:ribose transport system permease protein